MARLGGFGDSTHTGKCGAVTVASTPGTTISLTTNTATRTFVVALPDQAIPINGTVSLLAGDAATRVFVSASGNLKVAPVVSSALFDSKLTLSPGKSSILKDAQVRLRDASGILPRLTLPVLTLRSCRLPMCKSAEGVMEELTSLTDVILAKTTAFCADSDNSRYFRVTPGCACLG